MLAGFLSGLFGVGGGVLMVPAMVIALKMNQRLAHGTSLASVVPIAVAGTASYALSDEVDWAVTACLVAGALGGAVLGTHLLRFLPQRVLAHAFSALMIVTALRLVLDSADPSGRGALSALGVVALVCAGFASGVLAGLLGIGGGIVMVPVMLVGFDLSAAMAKGTSLAVIVPTALTGTWRNRNHGNVDLRVGVVIGVAGMLSAFAAGRVSIGMSERTSNLLFAALLTVMAIRMFWQARGMDEEVGHTVAPSEAPD